MKRLLPVVTLIVIFSGASFSQIIMSGGKKFSIFGGSALEPQAQSFSMGYEVSLAKWFSVGMEYATIPSDISAVQQSPERLRGTIAFYPLQKHFGKNLTIETRFFGGIGLMGYEREPGGELQNVTGTNFVGGASLCAVIYRSTRFRISPFVGVRRSVSAVKLVYAGLPRTTENRTLSTNYMLVGSAVFVNVSDGVQLAIQPGIDFAAAANRFFFNVGFVFP